MKRWFSIGLVFFVLLAVSVRFWSVWQQNQTAVAVVDRLSTTTSCAVDEARLQWEGDMLTMAMDPYLQMVAASALNTDIAPPAFEAWKRDPRLYYWFMAQTAVKNEAYSDSLVYLTTANAGSMLDAVGHFGATPACSIINWSIASELGYLEPPDGYVQHLMNHQLYEDVAEAFSHLLRYDSKRAAWRLSLGRAYIAMGKTAVAEETVAPILLNGTMDEIEAANELLQSIR